MAQQKHLSHYVLQFLQGPSCGAHIFARSALLEPGVDLQAMDIREIMLEAALNWAHESRCDFAESSRYDFAEILITIARLVECGAPLCNIVKTCVTELALPAVSRMHSPSRVKLDILIGVAHWFGRGAEVRQHWTDVDGYVKSLTHNIGETLLWAVVGNWPDTDKEWRKATIKRLILGGAPIRRATERVSKDKTLDQVPVMYKAACQAGCDADLIKAFQDMNIVDLFLSDLLGCTCGLESRQLLVRREMKALRSSGLLGPLATSMQVELNRRKVVLEDWLAPPRDEWEEEWFFPHQYEMDKNKLASISTCLGLLHEFAEADRRYAQYLSKNLAMRLQVGPAQLIAAFTITAPVPTQQQERRLFGGLAYTWPELLDFYGNMAEASEKWVMAVPDASNESMLPEEFVPQVIEWIDHGEPSQPIDPEVAHTVQELAWADSVEARLADPLLQAADPRGEGAAQDLVDEEEEDDRTIWLLRFGTASQNSAANTERFRTTLLEGPDLKPVRDALDAAGHPVELLSKAKVFVQPGEYRAILDHINQPLSPYHVILDSAYEDLFNAALSTIPYSKRPKEKRREPLTTTSYASDAIEIASDTEDAEVMFLVEEKTFLTCARTLRGRCSVAQSTTEATGAVEPFDYPQSNGRNPRRYLSEL